MPKPTDFTRTLEDPVTFLRLRALVLAPRMGVEVEVMDRLLSIVISALGSEWLNVAANDVPNAIPLPLPRHYLGHLVATAGEVQIGELLELGQYLEAVHAAPGADEVIVALRGAYHQTLLQLAMATRFQLAGARIVGLEPPATDGRFSDIQLEFQHTGYQVECFRPTYKRGDAQTDDVVRLEQAVLEKARESGRPYAVAVDFSEHPTPSRRREAVNVVGQAIATMDAAMDVPKGSVPAVLLRGPGVVVSVLPAMETVPGAPPVLPRHPDFPRKGNDFNSYMRIAMVARSDAIGIRAAVPPGVGTSCIGVWVPSDPLKEARDDADPGTVIEKFGRKIEKKMAQARSEAGHARIIVVDAWEADRVRDEGKSFAERLRGKLVRAHDNVAAVLLTHRRWTEQKLRHTYPLTALVGDRPSGNLQALLDQVFTIDSP